MGWPKIRLSFSCNILWKNSNYFFGQPNIYYASADRKQGQGTSPCLSDTLKFKRHLGSQPGLFCFLSCTALPLMPPPLPHAPPPPAPSPSFSSPFLPSYPSSCPTPTTPLSLLPLPSCASLHPPSVPPHPSLPSSLPSLISLLLQPLSPA